MNEKDLAKLLGPKIAREYDRFKFVTANTNVASMRFRDYWEEHFKGTPPPIRPEIDILLYDRLTRQLLALEIKYISAVDKTAYYEGLDQALALLRLGFHCVQLWHCFARLVPDQDVRAHAEGARTLLSDLEFWLKERDLSFPIGYAHLRVMEIDGSVELKEIFPYRDPPLLEYEKPPDPARFWKDNPLKDKEEPRRIREFIYHAFRLPQR